MATIANPGSAGGNWTPDTPKPVVTAGGPNGLKFVDSTGFITGPGIDTLVAASAGMIGLVFRTELETDAGNKWAGKGLFYFPGGYGGLAPRSAGGNKLCPWLYTTGGEVYTEHDYTAQTWRALVMRWDVDKLYSRMDGESVWQEVAAADGPASLSGGVVLLKGNTATDCDLTKPVTYNTQSVDAGNTLLAHLVSIAGL